MFVKICGTTNLQDAELSVHLGADALGFIFAKSKRRVTAEQAAEITHQLPEHILRVGIFTEPHTEEIVRTVQVAGLGAVQMHWPYNPAATQALRNGLGSRTQLWQVVGFVADAGDQYAADRSFAKALEASTKDQAVSVILLDSVKDGSSGGLGEAFSWKRAKPMVEAALASAKVDRPTEFRLVVAGGLRPENVHEAIGILHPWGVDVVSGVESGPGKKSPDRLAAFLAAAKS